MECLAGIHDYFGILGVLFVLGSYLLLQMGYLKAEHMSFSLANALGSLFLLISLYFDWNLSAVIIEAVWFLISVYGLVKHHSWK
jgi:hypothetical protein